MTSTGSEDEAISVVDGKSVEQRAEGAGIVCCLRARAARTVELGANRDTFLMQAASQYLSVNDAARGLPRAAARQMQPRLRSDRDVAQHHAFVGVQRRQAAGVQEQHPLGGLDGALARQADQARQIGRAHV